MTVHDARAVAEAAEIMTPEPPRPLRRETPPAESFPVEALGDVLGAAALGVHDRVQAPVAICAQAVLGAATLAVQGHADVELPTGHRRPVSGYFVTIAETGERKTACDGEALWPIRKREAALRERHDGALFAWTNDRDAWTKQRDQILADKSKNASREAKRAALDTLGPPPAPPLDPLLTCPEPTFEGLCRMMPTGQPSLGLFSAEGGQFIGGHGMSADHRLKTAAALSAFWDGEPVKRVRAGDGVMVLPGRRLALHLMVQPAVAAALLSDPMLRDQGLLSRILVAAPASASGTRLWREPKPESDAAIKRYGARLLSILETPFPLAEGRANELRPRVLPLAPKARAAWVAFADHIERLIAPDGPLAPIRGLANKLPEHAARLAAVLALTDDLNAPEVAERHVAVGIELAQHYASEALRLADEGKTDPDLRLGERTLAWLVASWTEPLISLRDLYRLGPNPIRDQATARRIVGILEDHGWLAHLPRGAIVAGTFRRDVWRIACEAAV